MKWLRREVRGILDNFLGTPRAQQEIARVKTLMSAEPCSPSHLAAVGFDVPEVTGEPGPVFLLSSAWRSGSTLLQRLVASGGEALIWGEPFGQAHIIQRLAASMEAFTMAWPRESDFLSYDEPVDLAATWTANLYPPLAAVRRAHRGFFRRMFEEPAREAGFNRWGIKAVRLGAREARYLRWLFPDARFIFQVRNPWTAYLSYKQFGLAWFDRWPDRPVFGASAFGAHWRRLTDDFMACTEDLDAMLVRYEDLVSDRSVVDGLASLLGAELDPRVLDERIDGRGNRRRERVGLSWYERVQLGRRVEPTAGRLGYGP